MNPFMRGKRGRLLSFLVLFLFIAFLMPVFAADSVSSAGASQLGKKKLPSQPGQQLPNPNQQLPNPPGQQLPNPNQQLPNPPGQQLPNPNQQLPNPPGHQLPNPNQQLPNPPGQQLPNPNQQLPNPPGHQLPNPNQQLPNPPGQQLPNPNQQLPNPPGQQLPNPNQPPAEKPKAGDLILQINNDTDFALSVRASIVDASERVNLTRAKSISLAAHAQGTVALTSMTAGKVSLTPATSKGEVSKDSKILLTINKDKETKRLVLGYGKSGGVIVLGKDLFQQTREQPPLPKGPNPPEENDKSRDRPVVSGKADTVYVVNQAGAPIVCNAFFKPAKFDPVQIELKAGANVLKFTAKKNAPGSDKISLILQMRYNLPGNPTVLYKKDALDLDSHPTIVITREIMGEIVRQSPIDKKPK